jgi:hypothetical protein
MIPQFKITYNEVNGLILSVFVVRYKIKSFRATNHVEWLREEKATISRTISVLVS